MRKKADKANSAPGSGDKSSVTQPNIDKTATSAPQCNGMSKDAMPICDKTVEPAPQLKFKPGDSLPFGEITSEWFLSAFGQPTPVQAAAWPVIAAGRDTLVSAPTGTGKTLSAFLVFIDKLSELARQKKLKPELYLIYISPLKSLAGDIRENLRKPLDGISRTENLRKPLDGISRTENLRKPLDGISRTENLRKPLDGISRTENLRKPLDNTERIRITEGFERFTSGAAEITIGVRTGDTNAADRRAMFKKPPHILITTPESLYILLTSLSGVRILRTARAVIIDELHAMIGTKRGAHLLLSIARLDALRGSPLQRIGLSATIEPLDTAARYLSADGAAIVSPNSEKAIELTVKSAMPKSGVLPKGTIWPEIAFEIYTACKETRCVIAFVESRMHAEKLAYHVNQLAGEGFALTHHGSVSKERRALAEQSLREGKLRLLCATSSMELGIDVGDIDLVIQIGCPRTVSSAKQRLGRAGHNPGRVSVMLIFPRTPAEGLSCGITAELTRKGVIEPATPPKGCLDILAQHLVSMSAAGEFTVGDVRTIISRTHPFSGVTDEQIDGVLRMLAGDFEHAKDIPARPRLLYDRINGRARGDAYSRLLALSAGGTIPDRGLFAVRGENGVRFGEVDEEFVFEARVGDKFLLGAFAWRILSIDRDEVIVAQSGTEGVQPPFWKGEAGGRALSMGMAYGREMRAISEAAASVYDDADARGGVYLYDENRVPDRLDQALYKLGLDPVAADGAKGVIMRQMEATGALPDDRTIIVEHFQNELAEDQLVVHSVFGRRINAPLALLAREAARVITGSDVGVYDDDDGFLLFPIGGNALPEGLIYMIDPASARRTLSAMLPSTPVFSMSFRYCATRALMMGVRKRGRQPLWIQRQRSAKLLDSIIAEDGHPLIEETKRECIEDYWDMPGLEYILEAIRSGAIEVREINPGKPSPMSLPLRRAVEADLMYDYTPASPKVVDLTRDAVAAAVSSGKAIAPAKQELENVAWRDKKLTDEHQLHALLMTEGDQLAGEIDAPVEWLEELTRRGRAFYIEPGLWIAAEHLPEYRVAFRGIHEIGAGGDPPDAELERVAKRIPDQEHTPDADYKPDAPDGEAHAAAARLHIVRRVLRYHGGHTPGQISDRYSWDDAVTRAALDALAERGEAVRDGDAYYHGGLYELARRKTVLARRAIIKTQPPERYAALLSGRVGRDAGTPAERVLNALYSLCEQPYHASAWESSLLPGRVSGYRPELLDGALARGELFWKVGGGMSLTFYRYEDIDWESADAPPTADEANEHMSNLAPAPADAPALDPDEQIVLDALRKRGALFTQGITAALDGRSPYDALLSLVSNGFVRSDSFAPIRQALDKDKAQKANTRQRAYARAQMLTSGRWELARGVITRPMEEQLMRAFDKSLLICRETVPQLSWQQALATLRVWEYTGRVRRGYYVAGLSGAQFVREEDFTFVTAALARVDSPVAWMTAPDPAQPWGKCLPHLPGRAFMNLPGSVVCLRGGLPIIVFERQGQVLRLLGEPPEGEKIVEALKEFAQLFSRRRFFYSKSSLTVKQYPPEAAELLQKAGFSRYMQDYVLYRK